MSVNQNEDLEQDVDPSQETEEISHTNGALDNRMKAIEENQQIMQLLNDPAIREVVSARQQGRQVKVVADAQEEVEAADETPEPSLTDGLEDSDPTKATLSRIEAALKRREEKFHAKIAEQNQTIAQLSAVAQEVKHRDVKEQVSGAQKKYKDLAEFKTPMIELSNKFPGLGVEQLYVLAKHNAGKLKMVEQATFSEKPTAQPSRSANSARGRQKPQNGRQGFSNMLGDVLKNLELSDTE